MGASAWSTEFAVEEGGDLCTGVLVRDWRNRGTSRRCPTENPPSQNGTKPIRRRSGERIWFHFAPRVPLNAAWPRETKQGREGAQKINWIKLR